jgi:DNA polymerase-3 subunit beta
MKLVIEEAPLLKALGHLASVTERRTTIPILSNVLIDASADGIALCATDMDIGLTIQLPARIERHGKLTTSTHTLHDIVRKLKDGAQIEFEADGQTGKHIGALAVRSGRSSFKVTVLPHDDFPQTKAGELPHEFSVTAAELRTLIDKTRFAISTEETRYYLNGIYLHASSNDDGVGVLRAVATDGHRLARIDVPLPEGARGMAGVIVPRKTVTEVRKLIDVAKDDNHIGIRTSSTKIEFTVGNATMTSKIIDGTFPDYDRVIPKGNDKVIVTATDDMKEAVDRVATIATERTKAIKFDFRADGIQLSATSPEHGTAVEEIEARYTGAQINVGFNHRYVLDLAQLLPALDAPQLGRRAAGLE